MPTRVSPAAVAFPTPARPAVGPLDSLPSPSDPAARRPGPRAAPSVLVMPAPGMRRGRGLRRVGGALGDVAGILALVYAFPLVILGVGIPIAVLVRLGLWAVGAL